MDLDILGVAVVVSVIGPAIMGYLTNRAHRKEKLEDYARQDAVAAQAAEAARLLSGRQDSIAAKADEAADLLLTSNVEVRKTAASTQKKLDAIHVLVNSSMTAAMQSELDAKRSQVALMKEVIDLKHAAGVPPGESALAAIVAIDTVIGELQAKLNDRLNASGEITKSA